MSSGHSGKRLPVWEYRFDEVGKPVGMRPLRMSGLLNGFGVHNLRDGMSSHVIHLESEQFGNRRSNVEVGNAIDANALGNACAPGDENSLHLGISVDVAVGARIRNVRDEIPF